MSNDCPEPLDRARQLRSTLIYGALAALALPFLPSAFRGALTFSIIVVILLLSIVIITGYLGQVSLVQLAVAGAAAFSVAHFGKDYGLGFPAAPLLGVLVATGLGVVCGIPALRVRGVSLAVITLAAAVAIQDFWFSNTTWGGSAGGSTVDDPSLFGFDFGSSGSLHGFNGAVPSPLFGWFALLALALVALVVSNLRRSGFGLDMLAVRANERAAAAAGVSVRSTKLAGFAISSTIAGIGGVMLAYQYGSIAPGSFDILTALDLIAFAYIWGITSVVGAVWGGLTFLGGIFAYALDNWFGLQGSWFTVIAGLLLIFTLVRQPDGIATTLSYYRGSVLRRTSSRPAAARAIR